MCVTTGSLADCAGLPSLFHPGDRGGPRRPTSTSPRLRGSHPLSYPNSHVGRLKLYVRGETDIVSLLLTTLYYYKTNPCFTKDNFWAHLSRTYGCTFSRQIAGVLSTKSYVSSVSRYFYTCGVITPEGIFCYNFRLPSLIRFSPLL